MIENCYSDEDEGFDTTNSMVVREGFNRTTIKDTTSRIFLKTWLFLRFKLKILFVLIS